MQARLTESDRGCVIFSAALLDEALEELLRASFRQSATDIKATIDPLFQGYAPLATFSAKIQLSFALGFLPKGTFKTIEIIRRLRNEFAHESGPIDFNDPRCAPRFQIIIKANESTRRAAEAAIGVPLEQSAVTKRFAFVGVVSLLLGRLDAYTAFIRNGQNLPKIVAALDEANDG